MQEIFVKISGLSHLKKPVVVLIMPSIDQDPAYDIDFQSHLKIQSPSFVGSILCWILTPQASHVGSGRRIMLIFVGYTF